MEDWKVITTETTITSFVHTGTFIKTYLACKNDDYLESQQDSHSK